jgi:hypothetical protein
MIKALINNLRHVVNLLSTWLQANAFFMLKHDYFVFLGFIPILYLIYRRVFYIRTPKNLLFDPKDITLLQIGIYFWLMTIFSYLLYKYCQKTWFPKEPKEPSPVILLWSREWALYLDRRANGFYKLSRYIYPFSTLFLQNICVLLLRYSSYSKIFVFMTNALPRIIISIFFLVDVFYFHKFHYFYLSLYLLILPLLYRALSYILLQHYITSMDAMNRYLIIENVPNDDNKTLKKFSFVDPNNSNSDLAEYLEYMYFPVASLPGLFTKMDTFKEKIMDKVNPIVYLINIIGWGYLFFYALTLIVS